MIDNCNIKAVFIDLDNTLYEYEPCNAAGKQAVLEFLSKETQIDYEKVKMIFEQSRALTQHALMTQSASRSRFFYIQKTIEALINKTDVTLNLKAHKVFWNAYFSQMKLRTYAFQFLNLLKEKKIPCLLVTNLTAEIQFEKIKHLHIEDYITYIISSEEVGVEKPNSASYLLALKKLNSQTSDTLILANQVMMIGDDLVNDIEASTQMSMQSFQIENENSFFKLIELFENMIIMKH